METETPTSRGERTRTAIVEAAFAQFVANGYHGTSMRQIADGAGIAVGGIYNHFAGKEEIFTAVIREYHPLTRALTALDQSSGQTTEALLRDVAHRIIAEFEAQPGLLNLVFIELVELEGRHLSQLVASFLPMLQQFAARLNDTPGQLRDVPPLTFVRTFLGTIFAYFFTEQLLAGTPAERLDTTTLDDFVDVYLHGALIDQEEQ